MLTKRLGMLFAGFLLVAGTVPVSAQISIPTGTPYTQNFNSIGTAASWTMPANWRMSNLNPNHRTPGLWSAALSSITSGTGAGQIGGNDVSGTAANGLYNFGAGVANSATDRALGSIASGTGTRSSGVMARFTNNSGDDLQSLTITYNVEKYRTGTNAAGWEVQMWYSTDGTNWTNAGTGFQTLFSADGANGGYASAPGVTTAVSGSLGVSIPNNTDIYLQWVQSVASGTTTSNAQGLGLDDVTVLGIAAAPSDTTPPTLPTVTLSSNNSNTALATTGNVITLSIVADEDITAPTVTIAGNAANVTGSGSNYTATYTVQAGDTQGPAAINISAYEDLASNAGSTVTATTNSSAVTIDTIAPTVASRVPAASATISALANVQVTFAENVTGVVAGDLTVNGSAATTLTGSAPTFTFSGFTAPADGAVNVVFASGVIADAAGNSFVGDSWTYTKNSVVPTVTLSAAVNDGDFTNGPVNFTATFSEDISGFIADDITVTNGSAGTLAGGPSIYTFTVTPTADGPVVVEVPADVAEGVAAPAGRLNTASNSFTFTLDTTAPVSAATQPTDGTFVGTAVAIDFTANDAGSGVSSVSLFVKAPSSASFVDSGLTPTGNTFTYTAAENGLFEFYTVATDIAGNVEVAPAAAQASVLVNTAANGAFTVSVGTGSNVTVVFPMENGIDVVIVFANVTNAGTVTVSRFETDAAPLGVSASRLIDQWLSIVGAGGLAFDTATVTFEYDNALLGGLLATEIDRVFRDTGSTVEEITAVIVNTGNETIEFTTPGFSDFYFGNNDADISDWNLLDIE